MGENILSYALISFLCGLVILKDVRIRILQKEDILFRIKDNKKYKLLLYVIGLLIPIVVVVLGLIIEKDIFSKIMIVFMGIEMITLWSLIELGDALITKSFIGKVWYTKVGSIEDYEIKEHKDKYYLIIVKKNNKRPEMMNINPEDQKKLRELLSGLIVKIS